MQVPVKQQDGRPDKAKLKLIEATLDSLMQDGMEGCSVRRISERAGVSTGLINYHFDSIHNLVAAAYQHLALRFLDSAIGACEADSQTPREQLSAFLQNIFSPNVMQRQVLRAWVVFWGLIDTDPAVQQAQAQSNGAFSDYLESIFTHLNAQKTLAISPRMASVGLTAMIDGLWLEWCLQPDSFSPDECITLCEHWVSSVSQRNDLH